MQATLLQIGCPRRVEYSHHSLSTYYVPGTEKMEILSLCFIEKKKKKLRDKGPLGMPGPEFKPDLGVPCL